MASLKFLLTQFTFCSFLYHFLLPFLWMGTGLVSRRLQDYTTATNRKQVFTKQVKVARVTRGHSTPYKSNNNNIFGYTKMHSAYLSLCYFFQNWPCYKYLCLAEAWKFQMYFTQMLQLAVWIFLCIPARGGRSIHHSPPSTISYTILPSQLPPPCWTNKNKGEDIFLIKYEILVC